MAMNRIFERAGSALHRIAGKVSRPAKATGTSDEFLALDYGFDNEVEAKEAVKLVRGNTMTSLERLVSLWNQVRYLDQYGVEGSLVECGVWKGGSIGLMALAHQRVGTARRELHLFDSFEGLPEPDSKVDGTKAISYSGQHAGGKLETIGKCVGPIEDSRELLFRRIGYPESKAKFHQGWFEETVPRVSATLGPIALLRLDGDWYSSTKICLDHLYERVVPNGVVVIDDYGHWEGCRKAVDEFLPKLGHPVMLHFVDYTARYWIKPAK